MGNRNRTKVFAATASSIPPRVKPSNYPQPYASRMAGREKRQLGDFLGLENFGVNLTKLSPGAESALMHQHSKQDEFIYVLEGSPTLITDDGETLLRPGMCAGFPAADLAHHLVNRTNDDVLFLEVGDRTKGDEVRYPNDDIQALMGCDGKWVFTHKDGRPMVRNK